MAEYQQNSNLKDSNIVIKHKQGVNGNINDEKMEKVESASNDRIENENVCSSKSDYSYVNEAMIEDESDVQSEDTNNQIESDCKYKIKEHQHNSNLEDSNIAIKHKQGINGHINNEKIERVKSATNDSIFICSTKSDYSYVNEAMIEDESDVRSEVINNHIESDNINIVHDNSNVLNNVKKEPKFENNTRSSGNLQLQSNLQQPIVEADSRSNHCGAKDSEMNTRDKYLKNNTYSVNFENKDVSQINLLKIPKPGLITKLPPHWRQFLAAMGPYLMILSAGLSCGFSATLLPQLKQEQSVILVDDQSPSWIASMAALPMAPGCFIGGWLMEKLGRRQALCVLSIPFFVGWVLIASASNLSLMLVGRFLNGLSIGLLAPAMSVFISETSHPKLRGMFLAFLSFNIALGILIAHFIGTWITWQWTSIICAIFPLFSAGLLAFFPESPVWLFSKGRFDDAIKAFYWLRGSGDEVETELRGLIEKFKNVDSSSSETLIKKIKNLRSATFSKPLIIVVTIYLTCQYAGIHTITFYSVDILEMAVGKGVDSYLAMLVIDVLRVIATLVTVYTSRKCPRRTLCITSGCLSTLSFAGLSGFLYAYNNKVPPNLTMIPLCLISAYIIAINIGLMPLPWIIVGEIFPARHRSFGAGLASAIGYFSTFVVVKTAPGMMVNLGQVVTFMFYSMVALVGTVILYFIMPETKGKSLLDIEKMFEKNRSVKSHI